MRERTFEVIRFAQLAAVISSLLALPAHAQTTPGQVGDTLKRPPELKQPQEAPIVETEKPAAPAPAGAKGKTVKVTAFEFSGISVYSQAQLSEQIGEFLNRPVTLLDIYAAADKIAEFYANAGYTLASVNVPPQKISDGTVLLEVSEGRIGEVVLEDNSSQRVGLVRQFLGVRNGELYRSDTVDNGMQNLNELPGLTARAVIKPGAEYGTSDLVIRNTEAPVSGVMFVDNYGRKSIGETRYAASVNFNNLTGAEDQLQLLGLESSNSLLRYYYGAYNIPLGFAGDRLVFSYGHAAFDVVDIPGLNGSSHNGKVEVQHPLLRTRANRLNLTAGVSRTYSNTDLSGAALPGTSITLLELGATYNHLYSSAAVTQLTTSLASNFDRQVRADLTPPAPPASQVLRGDQRLRAEVDLIHFQPLSAEKQMALVAHFDGVWSPDPLSDPSAFSIGGPQSIRGYPASEVRGDRGYVGQLTLQQRYLFASTQVTGRVFADSGKVYSIDPTPPQSKQASLTSLGLGADFDFNRISLKLDWSSPRDGHVASDGRNKGRVYGSLFVNF